MSEKEAILQPDRNCYSTYKMNKEIADSGSKTLNTISSEAKTVHSVANLEEIINKLIYHMQENH